MIEKVWQFHHRCEKSGKKVSMTDKGPIKTDERNEMKRQPL